MELFIQIENGMPINHPIVEKNFCEVFPHIDINNLPPEFARFERVYEPDPIDGFKFIHDGYSLVGEVYQDVWLTVPLTSEEIAQIAAQNNNVIQREIEVSRVANP
jgi:hypothetical protein